MFRLRKVAQARQGNRLFYLLGRWALGYGLKLLRARSLAAYQLLSVAPSAFCLRSDAMGLSGSHLHADIRDVAPFTTEIVVQNNMQTPVLIIEAKHHGDATRPRWPVWNKITTGSAGMRVLDLDVLLLAHDFVSCNVCSIMSRRPCIDI